MVFVKLLLYWHDLIIVPPHPHVQQFHEKLFLEKISSPHTYCVLVPYMFLFTQK